MRCLMQDVKPTSTKDLRLSERLRSLLDICWAKIPTERPAAIVCSQALQDELGRKNQIQDYVEHEIRRQPLSEERSISDPPTESEAALCSPTEDLAVKPQEYEVGYGTWNVNVQAREESLTPVLAKRAADMENMKVALNQMLEFYQSRMQEVCIQAELAMQQKQIQGSPPGSSARATDHSEMHPSVGHLGPTSQAARFVSAYLNRPFGSLLISAESIVVQTRVSLLIAEREMGLRRRWAPLNQYSTSSLRRDQSPIQNPRQQPNSGVPQPSPRSLRFPIYSHPGLRMPLLDSR